MRTSFLVGKKSNPEEALELPKGRLMVGKLAVESFFPESVVDATTEIISECSDGEEYIFMSQAHIIAHAANMLSWNWRPKYETV